MKQVLERIAAENPNLAARLIVMTMPAVVAANPGAAAYTPGAIL